jgi:transcription elongation factor
MKLDKLSMVCRIAGERDKLRKQLEHGKIAVLIDGNHQDDTLVALVTPFVREELRSRIRALEADLKALGVQVS